MELQTSLIELTYQGQTTEGDQEQDDTLKIFVFDKQFSVMS